MGIIVGTVAQTGEQPRAASSAQIEEVHYWHLYPLIEAMRKEHGKYLDLYGDTRFSPSELPILQAFVEKALASVRSQPPEWRVCLGKTLDGREVLGEAQRGSFLSLLEGIRGIATAAEERGETVAFLGD